MERLCFHHAESGVLGFGDLGGRGCTALNRSSSLTVVALDRKAPKQGRRRKGASSGVHGGRHPRHVVAAGRFAQEGSLASLGC